jgi:ferritin-like metal-binding protein YciE
VVGLKEDPRLQSPSVWTHGEPAGKPLTLATQEAQMATVDSFKSLFVEQLKDLYDAEKRLTKAIPKLAKASTNEELGTALEEHLEETREHVSRLEQVFELLDEKAKSKPCKGMQGLIEEGDEHAKEDYDDDDLRDAIIIGSAQRVEHYEIAGYGTAIAHARLLGLDDVIELLEATLAEEKAADEKLTEIAESVVNLEAAEDQQEEEVQTSKRTSRGRSASGAKAAAADRGRSASGGRGRSNRR